MILFSTGFDHVAHTLCTLLVYPREFLDALFTLLSCVLQNQPGGQMLMSAGVIPMLVQILGNQQCIQTKVFIHGGERMAQDLCLRV